MCSIRMNRSAFLAATDVQTTARGEKLWIAIRSRVQAPTPGEGTAYLTSRFTTELASPPLEASLGGPSCDMNDGHDFGGDGSIPFS